MGAHILVVATSHNVMNDGHATGVWAEELAAPYYVFLDSGATITLASIKGGPIPFDPRSVNGGEPKPDCVMRFLADRAAMQAVQTTTPVERVDISTVDAIFLPGGHGTMWDLPGSKALAEKIAALDAGGKIVAAVCHGPAGLTDVVNNDGDPLVKGRRVTAFTNSEEEKVGLTKAVPFLLETKLRSLGADFVAAPDFQPHALRDGNLITGQNPASSEQVAQLILEALEANRVKAAEVAAE
ncbi:type 1 glutamine amidotransferase domain-containing protein [uncultured Ferrovibrio sp.]|jgi:putative intracellular protease/amidase|uniref:type 1 glutamine amidotransferase domain-containing protein n=1 Tax=uncultured Ferrovibrio sp. TaxID=1576913 RepID=UPI00262674C0|nr:type 1 glutamine amidotransferase domain-containing protein [uncultured Ferrovibrio sp.]